MAAPSNENQGLKIAVACFVMLSVVLAVTTYFGFKNYLETDKKLEDANATVSSEKKEQERLTRILNEFKDKTGFTKTEFDDLGKAITKSVEDLTKRAVAIRDASSKALADYKGAGGSLGKMEEIGQSNDAIISGLNDPARTLQSTADRLAELTNNQVLLATMLAAEFESTRKELENTNVVNKSSLDVQVDAAKTANANLMAEQEKHEKDRLGLGEKVGLLQEDTNKQAQEIAKLKNQIAQMEDDGNKQRTDLMTIVRDQRDRLLKTDKQFDVKDGTVTYVDYGRDEVRTDLRRSQGAREQMVLSIFDRKAPGLPTDRPKATIELIQVGETSSLARIVKTESSIDPIRSGDQVYSPGWDPNRPQQFALIGKMDVNRDGRDDREDLKRMIQASGGIVSYDLPPSGPEKGKLTPVIRWYVVDERGTIRPTTAREGNSVSSEEQAFLTKQTEAIKAARLEGIPPITIERLLSQLGYSYGTVTPGRVEAINRTGVDQILNPKGRVGTIPPAGETPPPEGEAPK